MTRKPVDYYVWYRGKETPDIKPGFIYHCIAEWYDQNGRLDSLSVVDRTGEDYIYFIEECEKVDLKKLAEDPDWKKYIEIPSVKDEKKKEMLLRYFQNDNNEPIKCPFCNTDLKEEWFGSGGIIKCGTEDCFYSFLRGI